MFEERCESSLDCSELQRAHAHQAKGTWDPPGVAQFDWSQEVVDRVLAWVYVTNENRKRKRPTGPDARSNEIFACRTMFSGSIDERAWCHANKPPGRCGRRDGEDAILDVSRTGKNGRSNVLAAHYRLDLRSRCYRQGRLTQTRFGQPSRSRIGQTPTLSPSPYTASLMGISGQV